MTPKEIAAVHAEIAASTGEPWGLARRVSKAAALIAAVSNLFPEVAAEPVRSAGLCAVVLAAFDLVTEAHQSVAVAAACDLIACEVAEVTGRPN